MRFLVIYVFFIASISLFGSSACKEKESTTPTDDDPDPGEAGDDPDDPDGADASVDGSPLRLTRIAYPAPGAYNDHYGWPVAAMGEGVLIVVFHRKVGHWGDDRPPDDDSSSAVFIRSEDLGETWSAAQDFRSIRGGQTTEGVKLKFGNSIIFTKVGNFIAVTKYGVFRSQDLGVTWEFLVGAFGQDQLPGDKVNNGPKMIEHDKHGILIAGHEYTGRDNDQGTELTTNKVWLRFSHDEGETWQEIMVPTLEDAQLVEPTLEDFDGEIVGIARNHAPTAHDKENKRYHYQQFFLKDQDLTKIRTARTDMYAADAGTKWYGNWCQDSLALAYNPVTERLEAVATNRCSMAPEDPDDWENLSLNLFSIAPEEFLQGLGNWTYETTLATYPGVLYKSTADGLHPGGAVMDIERKQQYIFLYAGAPSGPTGIYMLTRSLDTPRLPRDNLMIRIPR